MQRLCHPTPALRQAGAAVALALCLCAPFAGCGRAGRQKAREEIQQAGHAFTPAEFIKAAAHGDQALVEAYLQAGIDRNAQDERGDTALMAASEAGKKEVVKALLDENAKPDLQNKEGATALILAAAANQPDTMRVLIEANADVRVKDRKNWTALMRAVYDGHARVVDILLATSRDQLARDGQLDRALAVASLLGNNELVRLLLDHGAKINAAIENHQTALMYAATAGKLETVGLLLDRLADPRMVNSDDATASILALQRGHPEIAKLIDSHTPGLPPPGAAAAASITPGPLADVQANSAAGEAARAKNDKNDWLEQRGMKSGAPDDDGDGFSNEEELAAGTDPKDPKSHPPYAAKLRMKRVEGEEFPVIFDGEDGKKVHVTVRDKSSDLPGGVAERKLEVASGERVGDLPYVVARVHHRDTTEKDTGHPLDVSELTLSNIQTGAKIVLVKSMPTNSPDASAILIFGLDGTEISVKQGQQFTLPRDDRTHYEVIDIRPTQVILKVVGTNQTITVGT